MAHAGSGCTPFSLVYGSEAVLPPEIGSDLQSTTLTTTNDMNLRLNLNLLEERRELAFLRSARYKTQTESRQEGQKNWEGPYQVTDVKRTGTYVLADMQGRPIPRTWHIRQNFQLGDLEGLYAEKLATYFSAERRAKPETRKRFDSGVEESTREST
ncbi:hypothetical protein Tco_0333587 [Tanacetum coccineum]